MNFYKILGVDKNSSQEEIKQSYKKLILQHHPDKGGDEEQFKKIQQAYETLGNPEKRMNYDNPPRQSSIFEININGHSHFMNIVRQFQKPVQRIEITTTFEELYTTFSKEIELPFNIKFNFPLNQTKLQLHGEPNNYIIINRYTNIPENFQIINNSDLLVTQHINFYEALAGTIFQIDLPTETLNLKKTPTIKDQDIFSIANKGLLINEHGERGNLLIRFVLIYPELNEEKLKLLNNLFSS